MRSAACLNSSLTASSFHSELISLDKLSLLATGGPETQTSHLVSREDGRQLGPGEPRSALWSIVAKHWRVNHFIFFIFFFNVRTSLKTQRIHLIISIHSITIWIWIWGTQTKLWPPQLIEQLILIYRRLFNTFDRKWCVLYFPFMLFRTVLKLPPPNDCATILWFHAPSDWPTTAAAMTHSVCGVV